MRLNLLFLFALSFYSFIITDAHDEAHNHIYHIIPHTHDDAGWLVPFETYYKGSGTPFGECVECILNNIYEILDANKSRVFPYVEMSFFERWYRDQSLDRKEKVKQFVKNKQLFFSNAAWVMNDEACVYYEDVIEQFILGHQFVLSNFNYISRVGWSIDPFGHSSTHAYLLAQMGMNMAVFERVDYQTVETRKYDHSMEFVWIPDENFPEWNIIGHHNFMKYGGTDASHYCFPRNVCEGVQEKSLVRAVNWLHNQTYIYDTNEILWQIGNDFTFSYSAKEVYYAIEEFVEGVNNMGDSVDGKALLSTPEIYAEYWYKDYEKMNDTKFKIKTDDFFPLADVPTWTREIGYWTGYFTSKPTLKWHVRESSWFLQTSKKIILGSLMNIKDIDNQTKFSQKADSAVNVLERAVAILQHHDGVTGTSKKRTVDDYFDMMTEGRNVVWKVIQEAFAIEDKYLLNTNDSETVSQLQYFRCDTNASSIECDSLVHALSSEDCNPLLLKVYNPGNGRKFVHRIKVPHQNIKVVRGEKDLEYDIICTEDDYTNSNSQDCDLYLYDFFPSYESKLYLLQHSKNNDAIPEENLSINEEKTIELPYNSHFIVHNDKQTYSYKFCNREGQCIEDTFSVDYQYYKSVRNGQASGAYIMRLESSNRYKVADDIRCSVFRGKYVTTIKITRTGANSPNRYGKYDVVTKLRFNNNNLTNGIEIDTYLNSLNFEYNVDIGREVVILIKSKTVNNHGIFKTDSNGLKLITRSLNYQSDYLTDLTGHEVESNYFPINSVILLEDQSKNRSMSVVNERSQGGSSRFPGEVEFMIQRRIARDDARGVAEPLMDSESVVDYTSNVKSRKYINERVRCTHYYQLSNSRIKSNMRQTQIEIDTRLLSSYAQLPNGTTTKDFAPKSDFNHKKNNFPPSVKFSVRAYSAQNITIRLVNLHDTKTVNVSLIDSQNNIDLLTYLSGLRVSGGSSEIIEVSLSTVMTKLDALKGKFEVREAGNFDIDSLLIKDLSNFRMRPLEILTFNVTNIIFSEMNETTAASFYSHEDLSDPISETISNNHGFHQTIQKFEWDKSTLNKSNETTPPSKNDTSTNTTTHNNSEEPNSESNHEPNNTNENNDSEGPNTNGSETNGTAEPPKNSSQPSNNQTQTTNQTETNNTETNSNQTESTNTTDTKNNTSESNSEDEFVKERETILISTLSIILGALIVICILGICVIRVYKRSQREKYRNQLDEREPPSGASFDSPSVHIDDDKDDEEDDEEEEEEENAEEGEDEEEEKKEDISNSRNPNSGYNMNNNMYMPEHV